MAFLATALELLGITRQQPDYKAFSQSADPTNAGRVASTGTAPSSEFVYGTVVRAGVGHYDYEVNIGSRVVTAVALEAVGSNLVGASVGSLIVEGTEVLMLLPRRTASTGIIIGVIPPHDFARPEDGAAANKAYFSYWDNESFGGIGSESAYSISDTDKKYASRIFAGGGRPADIFPGNYVVQNDQGVGFGVTTAAAGIKASPQAEVRVSLIDDNVRVVSGHYQHFNASGLTQIFNDGGYITSESSGNMYQAEHAGMKSIGTSIIEWVRGLKSINSKHKKSSAKKAAKHTGNSRISSFVGYLGDIVNVFVSKPDPSEEPALTDTEAKHQGLMHMHVDASGRVMLRSAGGVSLERWDRIPVPKRLRQPWDPEGDKMEYVPEPEAKPAFEWEEEHPYGRSLQLRDANAWRYRGAYWRLHCQSKSKGKKDFYIPEERELECPDDKYDETGQGEEKFKDSDLRKAGIYIEDDGSIVMRDAWGSEIAMRGGSIVMNAPGQIEVRSGKSVVVLGGHDVVVKARQSVDVSATEHDVRIKGEKNVQMVSATGGVLIESKAEASSPWKDAGEAASGSGVALVAEKSTVFAGGKHVHLSGSKRVKVETFDKEDENKGSIWLSSNTIRGSAKKQISLVCNAKTGMLLDSTTGTLVGKRVGLIGGSSTFLSKGATQLVAQWAKTGINAYGILEPGMSSISDHLGETGWLLPYDGAGKKESHFTWRTSKECGTLDPVEFKAKRFAVYQPFWALAKAADGLKEIEGKPEAWEEKAIDEEYPWPGKEAMAQAYVKMDRELNVESTGVAKDRESMKPKSGKFSPASMDEYEVMPHK